MSYEIPQHGWSSITTPVDAIGMDRFYVDFIKSEYLVYPSHAEMVEYLLAVENGSAAYSDGLSAADARLFRETYDDSFAALSPARWSCSNDTRAVTIPKYPLVVGNEDSTLQPGLKITRLRPADMVALDKSLRAMNTKFSKPMPLSHIFGTFAELSGSDKQFIAMHEKGEGVSSELICSTCKTSHEGASVISWLASYKVTGIKFKFNPALLSFVMATSEQAANGFRMLDRHIVPFNAIQAVMDSSTYTEGKRFFFDHVISGLSERTITVFKSLKRSKFSMEIAAQWAIALSAFEFTWNDNTRLAVESVIHGGGTVDILGEIWSKDFNEVEYITPVLMTSLQSHVNDIDDSIMRSLVEA